MHHRAIVALALGCLALASLPLLAQSQPTLDDILAKYLEAKGGADKLRAVQSVKTTGRIKGPSGDAPVTVWAKRPNMMRRENSRDGQTLVVAFDGKTVWTMNSMVGPVPREITGAAAEMTRQDAADFDSVLLDYKQKGYQVELVGAETLDNQADRPVYHLKVTKKNGRAQDIYLDAKTMLESRISMEVEQMGMKGTAAIEFSDYKAVDGIMVPFRVRQIGNGKVVAEVVYDQIQFNQPIEDSMFRMPGAR